MLRARRFRPLTAGLLIAAFVAGGWMLYQRERYKHWAVHEPGMVYRSAWLSPGALRDVIEEHQIRAVVNLCDPIELRPEDWERQRTAVRGSGAKLFTVTMPTCVSSVDPAIRPHLEILSDPDNYPMLVHCQHGVTRTAKLLTIYDVMYRGKTAAQSLAAQPTFGRDDHNVNLRTFAFDFEKRYETAYPEARPERLRILAQ